MPWITKRLARQGMTQLSVAEFLDMLEFNYGNPAFLRAYLSTVRHFPLTDMQVHYRRLAHGTSESHRARPLLVIWGTHDEVVPYSSGKRLLSEWVPHHVLHTIEGAGHNLPLDNHEEVNDVIISFLQTTEVMDAM